MNSFLEYRKTQRALLEGKTPEVPKEAMVGRVKSLYDSGRYDITPHHDYDGRGSIEFHAIPKRPKNAVEFNSKVTRPGQEIEGKAWHDPEISTLHTPHPDDQFPRTHAVLKHDSGYTQELQDKKTKGVLFRGMSHEEFHNIKKTGKIQSQGGLNLGKEQDGLTYYSRDPSQAQSYAHSFATVAHKASGQHHAYVVAVKDPGTDVKVKGTGDDEVGIPHAISKDDILHVHVGRGFAGGHGSAASHKGWSGFEEGSSTAPSTSVGWKKTAMSDIK